MTREQIIKSLQLCSNEELDCSDCPYWRHEYCSNDMVQDALALIRELTEKNERLRTEVAREIFAELETSYPDEYFTGGIEITRQELNELKQKYGIE